MLRVTGEAQPVATKSKKRQSRKDDPGSILFEDKKGGVKSNEQSERDFYDMRVRFFQSIIS